MALAIENCISFRVRTVFALVVSSLLSASSLAAQQQPSGSAPITAGTGVAQPSSGEQGPPAQPAPQARVQKFDDWYYRCVDGKAADGSPTTNCEAAQIATVKQGEQDVNVLTLAIAKVPATPAAPAQKSGKQAASDLILTALVPLNMYLPAGLGIDAGGKSIMQVAYRNCNQAGCWSQQRLDAKMISGLTKAADGTGHVQMMNGQKVNIKFSLKGLPAALDALQKAASH